MTEVVESSATEKKVKYVLIGDASRVLGKPVVVFDLDGVLFDVSERLRAVLRELGADKIPDKGELRHRFWELFLSEKYMRLDKPNAHFVELAKEYKARGYGVVIVTGRIYESQGSRTLEQLQTSGVPFDLIVFRSKGEYAKDHQFKVQLIKELRLNVVKAYDDSPDVCSAYTAIGIDVECVQRGS